MEGLLAALSDHGLSQAGVVFLHGAFEAVTFMTGRPDFLDLALVYAMMNFIGVIAVLRFSKYGHFGDTDDEPSP